MVITKGKMQWQIQGTGPRPAPPYLRVWMTALPPHPPYLKVWIRH